MSLIELFGIWTLAQRAIIWKCSFTAENIFEILRDIYTSVGSCRRAEVEARLQQPQYSEEDRQKILKEAQQRERDFMRLQRQRFTIADFELLTIIGRGAFGEVSHLVSLFSASLRFRKMPRFYHSLLDTSFEFYGRNLMCLRWDCSAQYLRSSLLFQENTILLFPEGLYDVFKYHADLFRQMTVITTAMATEM